MEIQFLAIGELLADVITIDYSESLAQSKTFQILQGGSSANVAANLRWLGKNAELVAVVGDDGIGKFLLSEVITAGISGRYVQVTGAFPTSIVLVTKSRGTPDFIAYRSADTQISFVDDSLIAASKIIHTTAFALSKDPARTNIITAFSHARKYNKFVSVDWNFSPLIWRNDNGKAVFEHLMKMQPLLKISMDDISRFAGIDDAVEAMKFLDGFDHTAVCLTCGKEGVYYKSQTTSWQHAPAIPIEDIKDATGAGDAFWAGFISAFIDHVAIDDCVLQGLKIASEKIQKHGPLYRQ